MLHSLQEREGCKARVLNWDAQLCLSPPGWSRATWFCELVWGNVASCWCSYSQHLIQIWHDPPTDRKRFIDVRNPFNIEIPIHKCVNMTLHVVVKLFFFVEFIHFYVNRKMCIIWVVYIVIAKLISKNKIWNVILFGQIDSRICYFAFSHYLNLLFFLLE